jgi:hypothetical protein
MPRRRVEIVRRTLLKQKWYARFIADNDETLSRTTDHYANLGDLTAMLNEYFPTWPIAPGYVTRGRG